MENMTVRQIPERLLPDANNLYPSNEAVEKANFREKLLRNLLIYDMVILAF